ncbi:ER membrane protein complex subunit 1 [Hydra vulgaris]|uniref:ER membrane protein complex subunit 1 n=1 Tax=Hydra vulgaris TaxID=6087 RepID=T2M9E1_HYDVU|nr:ER membrane protein complex subunit 1 [Hydra vulgaris]
MAAMRSFCDAVSIFRIIFFYCIVNIFFIQLSFGLYEDQVGLFDWRHKYIGKAKYVYFETNHSRNQRAYVSTESNVIAAINAKTGHLLWRKVFADDDGDVAMLFYKSNVLITISGSSKIIRSWNSKNGHLIWESGVHKFIPLVDSRFKNLPNIMKNHQATILEDESLLVVSNQQICVVSLNDGSEIWHYDVSESSQLFGAWNYNNKIHLFSVKIMSDKSYVSISYLDPETGNVIESIDVEADWILNDHISCEIVSSCLICISSRTEVFVLNLKPEILSTFSKNSLDLKYFIEDSEFEKVENFQIIPLSLEKVSDKACIKLGKYSVLFKLNVDLLGVQVVKFLKTPGFFMSIDVLSKKLIFEISESVLKNQPCLKVNVFEYNTLETASNLESVIYLDAEIAPPIYGAVYLYQKQNELSYRFLLICEDYSMFLIQNVGNKEGKILWTRNEGLSQVSNVKMIELPPSTSALQLSLLHDEFSVNQNVGVFNKFINRVKAQFLHLQAFVSSLRKNHQFSNRNAEKSVSLKRDQFSIYKIILLMTKAKKLFAINSQNGEIVWSHFLPHVSSNGSFEIIEQRTSAHFPLPSQCILIAPLNLNKKNTVIYKFNPLTGEGLKEPVSIESYEYLQVAELPFEDDKSAKVVGVVTSEKQLKIYPQNSYTINKLKSHMDSIYIYLANQTTNTFIGYKIKETHSNFELNEVWSIFIPENQKLIVQKKKRNDEVVNSVGRVLGDHSVLYKYLNPNLIAFMTQQGSGVKGTSYVYLVDGVTGFIIYSSFHRSADLPLDLIHSENWLIYQYYSTKHRRTEMSVVELYEGFEEKNNTAFSSLDPGSSPMILSQGYFLPVSGVRTLAATITQRGITNRNILIGLENGFIHSLPKNFFDPRRNLKQSEMLNEEGVLPYSPELPVSPKGFINYNMTVEKIRGIHTASAGLESTSLVLAYGLDLYFTRVMPSRMFDVLKEDFDYIFISGVLSLLIFSSLICGKMAFIKSLRMTWQ